MNQYDPEFDFDFEVDWDSAKSESNFHKRDIDFYEALAVFGDPLHIEALSVRNEFKEIRRVVVGRLGDDIYSEICTDHDSVTRIISVRRASRYERRQYRQSSKVA